MHRCLRAFLCGSVAIAGLAAAGGAWADAADGRAAELDESS